LDLSPIVFLTERPLDDVGIARVCDDRRQCLALQLLKAMVPVRAGKAFMPWPPHVPLAVPRAVRQGVGKHHRARVLVPAMGPCCASRLAWWASKVVVSTCPESALPTSCSARHPRWQGSQQRFAIRGRSQLGGRSSERGRSPSGGPRGITPATCDL
jgi:hypothetical protein